ncbi:MAG: hypothetical protein F6K58_08720 [Symploca sp. SIO2E9]|nr:hypothetical protein [Symploca sp. SIO2E9]
MTIDINAFLSTWQQIWAEQTNDNVTLKDTPAYLLGRTVEMPPSVGYETGALSFRLTQMEIRGISNLIADRCSLENIGDRIRIKLELEGVTFQGSYALEVKPDPIVEIDSAGNLMELSAETRRPVVAGKSVDDDEEKEALRSQHSLITSGSAIAFHSTIAFAFCS